MAHLVSLTVIPGSYSRVFIVRINQALDLVLSFAQFAKLNLGPNSPFGIGFGNLLQARNSRLSGLNLRALL
jgi:hypothetical protein